MEFSTHTVRSADGTTIGYRQTGHGKGLIICHGGGRISQNYAKLAMALADSYCVYIPDRRGRGLSGPEGSSYGMQQATEDLIAVMDATGADAIFGHSAGALIALETMLSKPLSKIALYEPPLSFGGAFAPCRRPVRQVEPEFRIILPGRAAASELWALSEI